MEMRAPSRERLYARDSHDGRVRAQYAAPA
jgi:hypothetical protein